MFVAVRKLNARGLIYMYLYNVFNVLEYCTYMSDFPSDAAERELFQVSFSADDMGWKTTVKNIIHFPSWARGKGHWARGIGQGARGIGTCISGVRWPVLEADQAIRILCGG
jgi:hypothetical protein